LTGRGKATEETPDHLNGDSPSPERESPSRLMKEGLQPLDLEKKQSITTPGALRKKSDVKEANKGTKKESATEIRKKEEAD
jgi:hypothetical protein